MPELTQDYVKHLFDYQEGELLWKSPTANRVHVGDKAGTIGLNGYRYITVKYRMYLAHRMVFLWWHGYWPKEIDHKNEIKTDNRIENLREITRSGNIRNTSSLMSTNTSGITGVCWSKKSRKWRAQLKRDGKGYLGEFLHFADAVKCRVDAEQKYFPEFYPQRDYHK